MGVVVVRPDIQGQAALKRSAGWQDVADQIAGEGLDYAQSIAPVDTGAYRDSLRVESGDGEARIVSDDPGAIAIENGAPNRPGFNVLSRTADYLESL